MKKLFMLLTLILSIVTISACAQNKSADYNSEKSFETALNKGKDLENKTVKIKVNKIVPNSAFGYNIQTGKHLNFVSDDNPKVKKGDTLILKVKNIKSVLGSYIITYDKQ
ncbi:hypothetical protein [Companilactobacillus zhongbaensis]|uniref:hypothetical protein n=1 Tax=Companilactobacillus zhongbaensis TaxID=2486009 RepID=UPI000F7AB689|nr:hypothetical protein [Companilactobacillus zhongbaensis]